MNSFTCPIYWTETFKTKPDVVHLVGMNYYRNAHYHNQNKLKRDIEDQLKRNMYPASTIKTTFKVHYTLYYKNSSCDGSNIIALVEKIFLDFAQSANIIPNDCVKYHCGSTWKLGGQDKLNPRCEITLELPDAPI